MEHYKRATYQGGHKWGTNTCAQPSTSQSTGMGIQANRTWMASMLENTVTGMKGLP